MLGPLETTGELSCSIGPRGSESFGSRCSSRRGHGCPRNARLEKVCSPMVVGSGESGDWRSGRRCMCRATRCSPGTGCCCRGFKHHSTAGEKRKKQGRIWQTPESPSSAMLQLLPWCLQSSFHRSSPPLLMSCWEMSAGFAKHPAVLIPPWLHRPPESRQARTVRCCLLAGHS